MKTESISKFNHSISPNHKLMLLFTKSINLPLNIFEYIAHTSNHRAYPVRLPTVNIIQMCFLICPAVLVYLVHIYLVLILHFLHYLHEMPTCNAEQLGTQVKIENMKQVKRRGNKCKLN